MNESQKTIDKMAKLTNDASIKQRVTVIVRGGNAEVIDCPENIKVLIIDYDNNPNLDRISNIINAEIGHCGDDYKNYRLNMAVYIEDLYNEKFTQSEIKELLHKVLGLKTKHARVIIDKVFLFFEDMEG